jgi:glucose-6-phosphate isomerase
MSKTVSTTRLFNDTRDLLEMIINLTDNFPRARRYTVGADMQRHAVEMVRLFVEAYQTRDARRKTALLNAYSASFETVKVLSDLAVRKQWVQGRGRVSHLVVRIASIGKQLSALRSSIANAQDKEFVPGGGG